MMKRRRKHSGIDLDEDMVKIPRDERLVIGAHLNAHVGER